jgi:hypothetical protein
VQRIFGHNNTYAHEKTSGRRQFGNTSNTSPAERYLIGLNSGSGTVPSKNLGHRISPAESFLMSLNSGSDAKNPEDSDHGASILVLAGIQRSGYIHARSHAAPSQNSSSGVNHNTASTKLPTEFTFR